MLQSGAVGSEASLECGDAGSIPALAQWIKDPLLLQLWDRSQLWLWRRNSIYLGQGHKTNRTTPPQKKNFSSSAEVAKFPGLLSHM